MADPSDPFTRSVLDDFYQGAREFIETKRMLDGAEPLAQTPGEREAFDYILAGMLAYLATRAKRVGHEGVVEALLVAMHERRDS